MCLALCSGLLSHVILLPPCKVNTFIDLIFQMRKYGKVQTCYRINKLSACGFMAQQVLINDSML